MNRFLVLVSVSLLSAGISRAQTPKEVLFQAAANARHCSYKPEKIALDNDGNEKGVWKESQDDSEVLEKLASGNKGYMRALNSLQERRWLISEAGDSMEFEAAVPEELFYGPFGLIFRLYDFRILLKQNMRNGEWLPTFFEITIRYRFLGILTHEKQRGDVDCSAMASATQ